MNELMTIELARTPSTWFALLVGLAPMQHRAPIGTSFPVRESRTGVTERSRPQKRPRRSMGPWFDSVSFVHSFLVTYIFRKLRSTYPTPPCSICMFSILLGGAARSHLS